MSPNASFRPGLPTLLTLSAGMFMAVLDTNIVNLALPAMQRSLSASLSELTWIVDAYALSLAGLMLSAGWLADRLGARRVLAWSLGLFALTSLLCGLAPDARVLIIARLLQGLSAALFIPSSLGLLRHAFSDPARRARAVGLYGGLSATAAAAGPVLGGLLLGPLGWRGAFLVNVPIALAALLSIPFTVPGQPPAPKRGADLPGQLAGMLTLALICYALIEGPHLAHIWMLPALCAAALLSALAFWRLERANPQAMMPPALFGHPAFAAANWVGLVIGVAYFGSLLLLSLYLQQGLKLDALHAGLSMLPLAGCLVAGNLLAGRLLPKLGARRQIRDGLLLAAAGYLSLVWASQYALAWQLLAMLPLALGTALAIAPMTATVLETAPPHLSSTASAVLGAVRQTGALVGTAGAALVIARSADLRHALDIGLSIAALASLSGAWAASWVPKMREQSLPALAVSEH
ncbi:MFS transporter [Chromobacterium sp. IIBBL 290-4]|uniref:MFS transporter n=1 Tax=Chromobacterium sp. IIBBL 290-4 TaxID=2953890 RepID=UPI0020B7A542|nr:MFS transporter [Chromobacterium sp. IIBBL 290-4]UTH75357.1 MFS transporter [Chromobacterium sp. IIBBL 290-4]